MSTDVECLGRVVIIDGIPTEELTDSVESGQLRIVPSIIAAIERVEFGFFLRRAVGQLRRSTLAHTDIVERGRLIVRSLCQTGVHGELEVAIRKERVGNHQ